MQAFDENSLNEFSPTYNKLLPMNIKTFFNHNQLTTTLCEKRSFTLLFSWQWLWALGHSMRALMNRWSRQFVHAGKGVAAGLAALPLTISSQVNRRIYVGLGLMGVVAPLSSCFYMVFDRMAFDETWYHANYFHFFLLLGPSFFILFCLMGTFLLFPQGSMRAYLLAIPAGFTIGKILWLALVTSNHEFYRVVPQSFLLHGISISLVLFITLDWFTWRKFHREDAFEARLDSLATNADHFEDAKFKSMFKSVWREKKEFQSKY